MLPDIARSKLPFGPRGPELRHEVPIGTDNVWQMCRSANFAVMNLQDGSAEH